MNKRQLDDILEKYDMVISEAMYKELLNPKTQPFAMQFHEEPLAFTAIRALEASTPSKQASALLALLHSYFDCTALTSIAAIKDKARKASDHTGIKYNSCLEFIARSYGYNAWNALIHSGRFTE